MTVGERLKAARKAQGWSLRHLATRAGMSHVFLHNIERGDRSAHAWRVALVARLLGLDPASILLAYADEQAVKARAAVLGDVAALGTDE